MPPESSTDNPLLMREIPQTLDQLLEHVGKLFHCMTGPPLAYFEMPVTPQCEPGDSCIQYDKDPVERLVYVTLAYRTHPAHPGAEARLVMAMLEPFVEARRQIDERGGSPLVFWRRPPELRDYHALDSHGAQTERAMKGLICRLVIPGADLSAYANDEGELIELV